MMPLQRQQHRLDDRAGIPEHAAEDEESVATLMLDQRGMIRDCNSASEDLFGYRSSEVVWRHISLLLPQLADIDLVCNGQINPRLLFLSRLGGYFKVLRQNGERFPSDLFLLNLSNPGSTDLRMIVRPCQTS